MMMMMMMEISAKTRTDRRVNGVAEDEVSVVDLPQHLLYLGFGATRSAAAALASPWHGHHRPQQQHNRPSRPDSNIITSKKNKYCILSTVLTATDQKTQKSLKR